MSQKKWWNLFVEFEGKEGSTVQGGGEVDPEDINALLARTRALTEEAGVATEPDEPTGVEASPSPAATPPTTTTGIVEGRPLEAIYAEQGCVPPAPKTVEQITLFLDGLKAMPLEVQRQALEAMDHADTSWSLDDVVVDAQNKAEALRRAKEALAASMAGAQQAAQREIASQDERIAQTHATIEAEIEAHRKQIAELEALRDHEVGAAEEAKESAREQLLGTQQAAGREAERYDEHVARLEHFIRTFGPDEAPGGSS